MTDSETLMNSVNRPMSSLERSLAIKFLWNYAYRGNIVEGMIVLVTPEHVYGSSFESNIVGYIPLSLFISDCLLRGGFNV